MSLSGAAGAGPSPAWLLISEPGGGRKRMRVDPLPFMIGRQPGNQLVLRDTRVSRIHARILAEQDGYVIEDMQSLNGVFVNDERVARRKLQPSDRIGFGVADSYRLEFTRDEPTLERIAERISTPAGASGNLGRLSAVVDLARALEASLSTTDLLASLVDAALAITGAERGFLLLRQGEHLAIRVARDNRGGALLADDLRVPTSVIQQALSRRREPLAMRFDPHSLQDGLPIGTIAELELRSVLCVPLVKIRAGASDVAGDTLGVLYMDTRAGGADLAGGNRDLIQTLALEASTILENARLLEGERARERMEEELKIAREIQESLLPRRLPDTGWVRAAGRSIPSDQVGGDYFDLRQISPSAWALVNADVSGKGVSSALLAALLQGLFMAAPHTGSAPEESMSRLNAFLLERTGGEKYVTIFFGILNREGWLRYVNAGHGAGLLVRSGGGLERLPATSLPVGLQEEATYAAAEVRLSDGDKLVLYTDGLTEAENADEAFFGEAGIRRVARAHARTSARALFEALDSALARHTEGALQKDDIAFMVVEYRTEET